jgi:lysophospholipase L1-like esterase
MLAFGDSVTLGVGASVPERGWARRVAAARGESLVNGAVSGTQVAEMADAVYRIAVSRIAEDSPPPDRLWLAGYNDMRFWGCSPSGLASFGGSLAALLTYLALPPEGRVCAQSPVVALSGTWMTTPVYGGVVGRYSNQQGASLGAIVTGSTVYVGLTALTGVDAGGDAAIVVDGAEVIIAHCSGLPALGTGRPYAPLLVRVDGLAPGPHHIAVVVRSATGNVYVDWLGGNGDSALGAIVWLGDCLAMTPEWYGTFAPYAAGSSEAVRRFRIVTRAVVARLRGDGLAIRAVNVGDAFDLVRVADGVHPNDVGHAQIASAFLAAMAGG